MTDFRETAENLFNEGFNIIPLNADKSPIKSMYNTNYLYEKQSIFDEKYVCEKIGVTCGIASNGLEVIDFDKHQGQDIDSIFKAFIQDASVQDLVNSGKLGVYSTPSGGYHIMFICDNRFTVKSEVLARYEDKNIMIELRAGGSYVACYPSTGYQFIQGVEMVKLEQIENEDKIYLFNLARSFSQFKLEKSETHTSGKWGDWDKTKPWGKYNIENVNEAKDLLKSIGWEHTSDRTDLKTGNTIELWRRPGKVKGISATFGQHFNMFYCFSGSALPFEQNKAYSPTDILMLVKFKGEWSKTREHLEILYRVETSEEPKAISKFPLEVFPVNIQDLIKEFNQALNYKEDFLAVSFMFSIATLNGNKYKLRVKNGWTAATTFWFAVVGETGVMKTHPVNQMVEPVKNIDRKSKTEYDFKMEIHEAMDEKTKKQNRKPDYRQIMVSDSTLEALHYIHRINPRGLGYHKDELVGFFNDMNKYRKGSDEQFWLESYNNKSYVINRVTKEPLMIDNIMINIIGGIQPSILTGIASQSNGNGMIERFLYTSSESNIYPINSNDIAKEWIDWYNGSIESFDNRFSYVDSSNSELLEMSQEAFDKFIEIDTWLCEIQKSDDETSSLKNYLNKIKTYVPRIALLLCIIDMLYENGSLQVKIKHMTNAFTLAQYFVDSARNIFIAGEKTNEINSVRKVLSQKGMSKSEQIVEMYKKGFKQIDIAKMIGSPKSYVSKVLQEKTKVNENQ
jgi:DNA-binding winged helix-turn-helix (wHTH) protein